jgi:hypothetical protein
VVFCVSRAFCPCRYIISENHTECKYYFQKNQEKFSESCLCSGGFLQQLEQKALSAPGDPAVAGLCFHKHNIRADFPDAVPGDYVVIPAADHPEKTAGAGHHNGADVSLGHIDLNVADKSQTLAGTNADHFLALQFRKFDGHEAYLLFDFSVCLSGGK